MFLEFSIGCVRHSFSPGEWLPVVYMIGTVMISLHWWISRGSKR